MRPGNLAANCWQPFCCRVSKSKKFESMVAAIEKAGAHTKANDTNKKDLIMVAAGLQDPRKCKQNSNFTRTTR